MLFKLTYIICKCFRAYRSGRKLYFEIIDPIAPEFKNGKGRKCRKTKPEDEPEDDSDVSDSSPVNKPPPAKTAAVSISPVTESPPAAVTAVAVTKPPPVETAAVETKKKTHLHAKSPGKQPAKTSPSNEVLKKTKTMTLF